MCGNKNTSQSTTSSAPTPQAMSAYSNLLTQAGQVASTPYVPYTGEGVAPVNPQQYTGISNINEYATAAEPYIQEAEGLATNAATPVTAGQIDQYVNPWTSQVVNATEAQFVNTNAQQQQQVEGNAIAQGAFGGNREEVAQAELANQQQTAEAPVIAGLESQGYTQGVNTALTEQQAQESGASNVGSLGVAGENAALTGANAQVGAGTLEQQTQQALDTYNYQQYLNQLAYPFQTTQWLAGIDTGVGSQMGGTSQTDTQSSLLSQLLGGVTAGAGILGGSGAFGSSGWLAPAVAALARGGGVPADGIANRMPTIPESPRTLRAQQKQLIAGHRRVQMFPYGTKELPLPHGMSRITVHGEIFHFNPKRISAEVVRRHAENGDEHHLLDLGPFSKHEIMARMQGGEIPVAVVERHPDGTEVRAAAGTHVTAPHQAAHMARSRSPSHHIHFEDPRFTVLSRIHHHRADGGMVPGFDIGGAATGIAPAPYGVSGSPYGSAKLWVPQSSITRGRGAPPPPSAQNQQNQLNNQAKSVGQLANSIREGMNANPNAPLNIAPANGVASSPAGTNQPISGLPTLAQAPAGEGSEDAVYRRGGRVHYADGGAADIMLPEGINPDVIAAAPDFYSETAMEAGRLPSVAAPSSRRGGRVRGFADGGADDTDFYGGELGEVFYPSDKDWSGPPPEGISYSGAMFAPPAPKSAEFQGPPAEGVKYSGKQFAGPGDSSSEWSGPPSPRDTEWSGPPSGDETPPSASSSSAEWNGPPASGVAAAPRQRANRFADTEGAYGLPSGYLDRTAQIESGYNPQAYNEFSGAAGLFQFTPKTASQYGVDPMDPESSTKGAARLGADNMRVMREGLGRDPTAAELYLAHQQGANGALALINNPDAPAAKVVGRDAIRWNGGDPSMTAGQFVQMWKDKYETGTAGGNFTGSGRRLYAYAPTGLSDSSAPDTVPEGIAAPQRGGGYSATGVAPPGIDLSGNSKLWPALITAGGAMMASHSISPGVAIGEGITAGAQSYEQQKREEQAATLNQSKINLEARKLDDDLAWHRQQLNIETRKADTAEKAEQSLADWRKRMNLTPSGRETMDGHPIMVDRYSGQTFDGTTGQPVDQGAQTRPSKMNLKPSGRETSDGHPILYDATRPGTAIDGITGAELSGDVQTRPAQHSAGAVEGIANRLMEENQKQRQSNPSVPEMTFQEALALAHRAPNQDQETIRRLSLAQGAWKAWMADPANMGKKDAPEAALDYWERRYGVSAATGATSAAPTATPPAPSATSAPPAATPETKPPAGVPQGSRLQRNKNDPSAYRWLAPDGSTYSPDGKLLTGAPRANLP